jgi:biotin carboxyl carrier protein
MECEIEAGGRTRQVSVTPRGATLAATVDGKTWQLDVARVDAHTLSLLLDGGRSKEVVIVAGTAARPLTVHVDGLPIAVVMNGRRRTGRDDHGAGHGRRGPWKESDSAPESAITAPMPGKVVRVLVTAGEAVRRRQPLVVVEAMKMENEVRALRDGIVSRVHVVEGQSVDAGAPLIVIQ